MQPFAIIPLVHLTGMDSKRKIRFPVFDRTQLWQEDSALNSHVAHAIGWHGSPRVADHNLGHRRRGFRRAFEQLGVEAENLLPDLGKRPFAVA
jgi:hypothetical protein